MSCRSPVGNAPHMFRTFHPVAMTLGFGGGSPLFPLSFLLIVLLSLYQQIIFWQTIANLRSASAAPLITEVCISGAFSFCFCLFALGNTHNPKAYWMPDIAASGSAEEATNDQRTRYSSIPRCNYTTNLSIRQVFFQLFVIFAPDASNRLLNS